tara:strand:+ start:627 stop:1118 length:492 start_codon:yes stop_codon:yes gene_type:complete
MVQRRTNNGQIIDLDKLFAQQGEVPAVGNTGTDAEGNVRDPATGEIVEKSEDRVRAYYQDNPRSSTEQVSLKGPVPDAGGNIKPDPVQEPKTAKTAKENVRTSKQQTQKQPEQSVSQQMQDEIEPITKPKPLGYKEVELPNGDIDMIPYYTEEDAPNDKTKGV